MARGRRFDPCYSHKWNKFKTMKTFNDLKQGDIIYELDLVSGVVCSIQIVNILPLDVEKSVFVKIKGSSIPLYFDKDKSSFKIYDVMYFSNKEDCIDKLQNLINKIKVLQKSLNQSIKQLS